MAVTTGLGGAKRVSCIDRMVRRRGGHRPPPAFAALGRRALLEVGQDLPSPSGETSRDPRQLGDVDTVGTICSAGHDAMQEDDAITFLEHVHAGTKHARQMIGQAGQLVEVRGEEGAATETRRVVQVLDHRAGDGQSIPGRRATTDLVEQHEAPGSRVVQDVGQFEHLHHEGRLAG